MAELATVAQQVEASGYAEIVVRLRPGVKAFLEFLTVLAGDEALKVWNSNIQALFKHLVVGFVLKTALLLARFFIGDEKRRGSL